MGRAVEAASDFRIGETYIYTNCNKYICRKLPYIDACGDLKVGMEPLDEWGGYKIVWELDLFSAMGSCIWEWDEPSTPTRRKDSCTCDHYTLLHHGCQCGFVEKKSWEKRLNEIEKKKREEEK